MEKNSKKYLKSEKYKKLPMMVEKQEIEIPQKISHKDFFSKLKFIQFLLKLGYNSSINEKYENLYL